MACPHPDNHTHNATQVLAGTWASKQGCPCVPLSTISLASAIDRTGTVDMTPSVFTYFPFHVQDVQEAAVPGLVGHGVPTRRQCLSSEAGAHLREGGGTWNSSSVFPPVGQAQHRLRDMEGAGGAWLRSPLEQQEEWDSPRSPSLPLLVTPVGGLWSLPWSPGSGLPPALV